METSDPDDIFALCLLATHPQANLRAVTIHPGGRDQVAIVRKVLNRLERNIPIGADPPQDAKERVSEFHYDWLGPTLLEDPDCSAVGALQTSIAHKATLVTGAALKNIHRAYKLSQEREQPFFKEWTCQGGFAGDDVVPPEHRLPKFMGRTTCPTYNLNGDVRAALALLESPIPLVKMVSKNVCHGVIFGPEEAKGLPRGAHPGLDLLLEGMRVYFRKHPNGKALHDVVAASLALNPQPATWAWGRPYRLKGEWGFRVQESIANEPQRCITIGVDKPALYKSWIS